MKRILFACIMALLCSVWAGAQDISIFRLTKFSWTLSFNFQAIAEKEETNQVLYRDVQEIFREGMLGFNTAGYIYHPNFLTFQALFNIAGNRSKQKISSDWALSNFSNNTYNFNLSFFNKKKISVDVYLVSNYAASARIFQERFFNFYKSSGVRVFSRTRLFPFWLNIARNQMSSESLTFMERQEDSWEAELRVDVLSNKFSTSRFTLREKDYSEKTYDIHYLSTELFADFRHFYGARKRNLLLSVLTYNRLTGKFAVESLLARNEAAHYLSDSLVFNAAYAFNLSNTFNEAFTRHDFSASLNHQLFESLTSSLLAGARLENSDFKSMTSWQWQFSFSYKKKLPGGEIAIGTNQRYERSGNKFFSAIVSHSEGAEFSAANSLILNLRGIEIDSLRITDPSLSRLYVLNVDYEIFYLDGSLTIFRLPGGDIPEGAAVLLHYSYKAYPDFNLNTHFYQNLVSLSFLKYFRAYFSTNGTVYAISSAFTFAPYESYRRKILGVQVSSRFLNAEYAVEKNDATYTSYLAHNWRVSLAYAFSQRLRLSFNLTENYLDYDRKGIFTRFNVFSLDAAFIPLKRIVADLMYRAIKYDTSDFLRTRKSLLLRLQWQLQKLSFMALYDYFLDGTSDFNRQRDSFSIMLRRVF